MDQDAFRKTYRDMNERFCLFEKATLAGMCDCAHAARFCLAEREGVHCKSDEAQQQCEELLKLLRHHARFTLKSNDESGALPHSQALKIQIGGLLGIDTALNQRSKPAPFIDNVFQLVSESVKTFGTLQQLPYQEVIKQIAAYKVRGRRPKC